MIDKKQHPAMITFREYCKIIKEDWGKTSPIPKERYDFPDPIGNKGIKWIDLGLPSGTLWADGNIYNPSDDHGFWTWDKIMESEYCSFVPTREQLKELRNNCKLEWDWDGEYDGCKFVSKKNHNSVFFPTVGYRNSNGVVCEVGSLSLYWSSTRSDVDCACALGIECGDEYREAEVKDKNFWSLGGLLRPKN